MDNAITLALQFGVSEAVIALTIVAAGTSMPEVATSVVAAAKGKGDLALGNIVGSSLYNLLAITGLAGCIVPLTAPGVTMVHYGFLLGVPVLLWGLLFTGKRLRYWEGAALLATYGAFLLAV